jgi:hypothetical protein
MREGTSQAAFFGPSCEPDKAWLLTVKAQRTVLVMIVGIGDVYQGFHINSITEVVILCPGLYVAGCSKLRMRPPRLLRLAREGCWA